MKKSELYKELKANKNYYIPRKKSRPVGTGSPADIYFEYGQLYIIVDDGNCIPCERGYLIHVYKKPFTKKQDVKVFEGWINDMEALEWLLEGLNL